MIITVSEPAARDFPYHRFWHSTVIASPPVEQLGVTAVEPRTCIMCGWAGPQRKMIRVAGDSTDWAKMIRWGGPMRHSKWACRDEAACQERQSHRKEMTSG